MVLRPLRDICPDNLCQRHSIGGDGPGDRRVIDQELRLAIPVVAPARAARPHIAAKSRAQHFLLFRAGVFAGRNRNAVAARGLLCMRRRKGQ